DWLQANLFFRAEDGIRDFHVTGVQTCALPIYLERPREALALYQRFLDASPDATNRTVVEGLVEEMKVAIAALPPPDFILLPSRTHFESVAQAPVAVAPVEPKRVHEQWWFWTAAAVVVGGVATGVALAAQPGGELPPASLGDINLR